VKGNTKKLWLYYSITVIVSYLPLLIRLLVHSDRPDVNSYDPKDVLFASLALLLSNFTLVSDDDRIESISRTTILAGSAFLMIPILYYVETLMVNEPNINYEASTALKVGTIFFSIVSALVSLGANNMVYKGV